jgi:hypothetical protein
MGLSRGNNLLQNFKEKTAYPSPDPAQSGSLMHRVVLMISLYPQLHLFDFYKKRSRETFILKNIDMSDFRCTSKVYMPHCI